MSCNVVPSLPKLFLRVTKDVALQALKQTQYVVKDRFVIGFKGYNCSYSKNWPTASPLNLDIL